MKINTYKLFNADFRNQWFNFIEDDWEYDDFKANKRWNREWISFDCCYYLKEKEELYLGVTSFDNDIAYKFDVNKKEFVCLNFKDIADKYDAKFHRSLVYNPNDKKIYGAIALLHCVDKYLEAPGGAIVEIDVETNKMKKLEIPIPHCYIQSCDIDVKKNILYLQFFTPEYIGEYDIEKKKFRLLGLAGSGISGMAQAQNLLVDDKNTLWGAWCITRAWQNQPGVDAHRIFVKREEDEEITYLDKGLFYTNSTNGYKKPDCFFDIGDDFVYISSCDGSLYRADKNTYEIEYIIDPTKKKKGRFTAMIKASNGKVYATVGIQSECRIIEIDIENRHYKTICNLRDERGETCYQVHQMTEGKQGVLYCCENDNPYRSSWLWEIEL